MIPFNVSPHIGSKKNMSSRRREVTILSFLEMGD